MHIGLFPILYNDFNLYKSLTNRISEPGIQDGERKWKKENGLAVF